MTKEKIIGIVGGIGPYAGVDLMTKIMDNTIVQSDYDHLPVLLQSFPNEIADRTDFIIGKIEINPAIGIVKSIKRLNREGASVIGIACNAAHSELIMSKVEQETENEEIEIINMIDETRKFVIEQFPEIKRIGVLSITGAYLSKVYENSFSHTHISIIPLKPELQKQVHDVIWNSEYGIKARSNPVTKIAKEKLLDIIRIFEDKGAEAIILGCTEIPLALKEKRIRGLICINPTEILARSIIKKVNPTKLKPLHR